MTEKAAADIDAVKAAYERYQRSPGKLRPVNVQALAEILAGRGLYANSKVGQSRMSAIRAAVDYPQLEVSVNSLARDGWLVQLTYDQAHWLPVSSYGLNRNGRYYLSAADYAAAVKQRDQDDLSERRTRLYRAAEQAVVDEHRAEVVARYTTACEAEGIVP